MKILVLKNWDQDWIDLFKKIAPNIEFHDPLQDSIMPKIKDFDLVCFAGGNDVSPIVYNHQTHNTTRSSHALDMFCKLIYLECKRLNIPCVGICKGSQQLSVFNGATLYQDVNNHTRPHSIITSVGKEIEVNSTHHQMINLSSIKNSRDFELVAYAEDLATYRYYWNDRKQEFLNENRKGHKDPEVVWFPKTKDLACQYHPEWLPNAHPGRTYFEVLLEEYIICNTY